MGKYNFITIDFETADSFQDSICQIGITGVKNNKIEFSKSWYVNPQCDFDPFCVEVHGITPNRVKNAPTLIELYPEIHSIIKDNLIVAHNAVYDMKVLQKSTNRYDIDLCPTSFLCTLVLARKIIPEQGSYSLDNLCYKFGISQGKYHDAGDDSRVCAELALKLQELAGITFSIDSLEGLKELLDIQIGYVDSKTYNGCKKNRASQETTRGKAEVVIRVDMHDKNSIFYQKNVCFTGTLNTMSRNEAKQIIANIGGIVQNGINKKTNFLICGTQDIQKVGDDGLSSKQEKVIKLQQSGCDIIIMTEEEFLKNIRDTNSHPKITI